jgi:hypothetical protein
MAYLALRQSKLSRSRRSNLDYAAKLFKCGCGAVCCDLVLSHPDQAPGRFCLGTRAVHHHLHHQA